MIDPSASVMLLKLFRFWPGRIGFGGTISETQVFYDWLQAEYGHLPAVRAASSTEELHDFLEMNTPRLQSSGTRPSNMRREDRVQCEVGVFIRAGSAAADPPVAMRAKTLDVCVHGLRIQADAPVPEGSVLNLVITPKGFPIRMFGLIGMPVWSRSNSEGAVIGIGLLEGGDFARWGEEFTDRFVHTNRSSAR